MCTLIALHRVHPGAALVIAANRDEFFERPAQGPALRASHAGSVVAPLDTRAGGTWLGVNRAGVFAAITNVSCPEPDPERRSRGWLVMDALAARSAREAAEKLEGLPMGSYNPFNLFVADAEDAFGFCYEESVRAVPQGEGAWVIGNAPLDGAEPTKLAALRRRLEAVDAERADDGLLDDLADLCREHEPGPRGPLDAVCVHTEAYGTRSSCLLRLSDAGLGDASSVLRWAEGAPCRNDYRDFSPLLRDLGRGRPGVEGA
jgi:uncharacterized protein with NRDE domain